MKAMGKYATHSTFMYLEQECMYSGDNIVFKISEVLGTGLICRLNT
jgi:hypothetical protein